MGAAFNNMMEEDSKAELAQRCCDLIDEVASLTSKLHKATHGGCGKPGHTTSPTDPAEGEGSTYYCLTCEAERSAADYKQHFELELAKNHEETWHWMGDGWDFPDSLTCPVIMTAEKLRALLAMPSYRKELEGRVNRLSSRVDELTLAGSQKSTRIKCLEAQVQLAEQQAAEARSLLAQAALAIPEVSGPVHERIHILRRDLSEQARIGGRR